MMGLAINLLWFMLYVVCLCAVVALVLYGINTFVYTLPELVVRGVWFIVLLLVLIALLTLLAGGGVVPHAPLSLR